MKYTYWTRITTLNKTISLSHDTSTFLVLRKSISNNKRGFQSFVDEINEKNIFFLSNQIVKSEILFNFEGEF